MWRKLINWVRRHHEHVDSVDVSLAAGSVVFVPAGMTVTGAERSVVIRSEDLATPSAATDLTSTRAADLCSECVGYWQYLDGENETPPAVMESEKERLEATRVRLQATFERSNRYGAAVRELFRRVDPNIARWAVEILNHSTYEARELGATLVGEAKTRAVLGSCEPEAVRRLGRLALREPTVDNKEIQANVQAVHALAVLGFEASLPILRTLLLDDGWWTDDEIRYDAAEVLGAIIGVDFTSAPDWTAAAADWLREHPDAAT